MTPDVLPVDTVISAAGNVHKPHLEQHPGRPTALVFFTVLAIGLLFNACNLMQDIDDVGPTTTTWMPFLLLGVALPIVPGSELVDGFHDTANVVVTVVYIHSLSLYSTVVWSGCLNFLGVLFSSGTVAFGIIALLLMVLVLQVGSSTGFAMVFALLIVATLWNPGTWWLGPPAPFSYILTDSIIGVGVVNALIHGRDDTNGVDWGQVTEVSYFLLLSPLLGFAHATPLLLVLRLLMKNRTLYKAPRGKAPFPWWIRDLLILTCTGVSSARGSNKG